MGEMVNSNKEDYGPTIGNVDTLLLFTSKRNSNKDPMNKTYNEDLFYTVRQDTMWGYCRRF